MNYPDSRVATQLRVTKLTNTRGPLTKRYSRGADGALQKVTAATLYEGQAESLAPPNLEAFMEMRSQLKPSEALMYGATGHQRVQVTTKKALRADPSLRRQAIARDAESVHYGRQPGILMLDHDAEHMPVAYSRDALRAALLAAVPELGLAAMGWATSASSCLYDTSTGECLQALRGQRLYIPLLDMTDAPRVGRLIYERLWAAGAGVFILSASGALLDRNLIDASAFQPERIDFAAGALCEAPIEQRVPPWHIWPDPMGSIDPWDSRAWLPDLSAEQAAAASVHRAAARAAVTDDAKAARASYIETRAATLAKALGLPLDDAHQRVREAVELNMLFADFLLYPAEGGPVTVGAVLDDPQRWHAARFADPIEPDYRGDTRIAYANLRSGGRPYLYSHAHGLGTRYELLRQPAQLEVRPGDNARLTDECLRIARSWGDLYDFGSQDLVRVVGGQVVSASSRYVRDYLSRRVRFLRADPRARKGEPALKPTDCPDRVAEAIVDRVGERDLPRLRGVVTAPTLRPDGTVLLAPGFDAATGLLHLTDETDPAPITACPDRAEVLAALAELMEPIMGFPFADAESRGVALAALLTATVRRNLSTAPGFAIDAPAPGTGKSLLAKVVLALGGHQSASHKPPPNDEECGKVLFAALRAGAGALFFDNYATPIGGPAIDHFLTAEEYAGRILGSSVNQPSLPNGALVLFTGNNLEVMGDTCRRLLTCRLDAGVEHPSRRSFAFDPEQFVRARRGRLVRAALTMLRGYLTSGAAPKGRPLGSFEVWDALVRQCVCWLGDIQVEFALGDPNATTERSEVADDGRSVLAGLLEAWQLAFGDGPATAAQALELAQGGSAFEPSAAGEVLSTAFQPMARHARDPLSAKRLGHWLRTNKDKFANDRRFEGFTGRDGITRWSVHAADAGFAGIAGSVQPPLSRNGKNIFIEGGSNHTPQSQRTQQAANLSQFADLA